MPKLGQFRCARHVYMILHMIRVFTWYVILECPTLELLDHFTNVCIYTPLQLPPTRGGLLHWEARRTRICLEFQPLQRHPLFP